MPQPLPESFPPETAEEDECDEDAENVVANLVNGEKQVKHNEKQIEQRPLTRPCLMVSLGLNVILVGLLCRLQIRETPATPSSLPTSTVSPGIPYSPQPTFSQAVSHSEAPLTVTGGLPSPRPSQVLGATTPLPVPSGAQTHSRNVYIDLGTSWANTLRLHLDLFPEMRWKPWEVYGFEADAWIAPFVDHFVAWLNGQRPRPRLTVPPAGSSVQYAAYGPRYGCPGESRDWDEVVKTRECVLNKFAGAFSQLRTNQTLMKPELVDARLAVAGERWTDSSHTRYTFVPAAVSNMRGTLRTRPRGFFRFGNQAATGVAVPMIDFPGWLAANFQQEDFIFVKMDVEGAEFGIINSLLDKGKGCLIDVLAIECHQHGGSCPDLLNRIRKTGCIKLLTEGVGYRDFDSESTVEKFFPDPPDGP